MNIESMMLHLHLSVVSNLTLSLFLTIFSLVHCNSLTSSGSCMLESVLSQLIMKVISDKGASVD